MDKELKNSIIILALDNLISMCSNALEEPDEDLKKEDREYIQSIINIANTALSEYASEKEQKPQWQKLSHSTI